MNAHSFHIEQDSVGKIRILQTTIIKKKLEEVAHKEYQ